MSSKLPWYKRYPMDFMTDSDVQAMSWSERGIYNWLLDIQWVEGSIPADMETLSKILHLRKSSLEKLNWLPKLFQLVDGVRINIRLEEERSKSIAINKKREIIGREGGKKKAENRSKRLANAYQGSTHPEPEPDKEKKKDEEKEKEKEEKEKSTPPKSSKCKQEVSMKERKRKRTGRTHLYKWIPPTSHAPPSIDVPPTSKPPTSHAGGPPTPDAPPPPPSDAPLSIPLKDTTEGLLGQQEDKSKVTVKKKPRNPPQVEAIAWAVPDELRGLTLYEADQKLCRRWPEQYPGWRRAFPNVNIETEVAKAHAWELGRPVSARKKDRVRFLNGWLGRARPPTPDELEAVRADEAQFERASLAWEASGMEDVLEAERLKAKGRG